MQTSRMLVRWLLPASLVVNVFLSAALLAHLLVDWTHQAPPSPPPNRMLEDMSRNLAPEDAAILHQALSGSLAAIEEARHAEEALPSRLGEILRHEPFDEAAFREQLAKPQRARELLNDAFPAAIAKLSPEGRRRLADMRPPRGGPPPHDQPPFDCPPDGREGPPHDRPPMEGHQPPPR